MSEIIISIKPKFANLIENKFKNHEFRKNIPKNTPQKIWIYVTIPVGQLKYVAEVGEIIEFPSKINEGGIGNIEFNTGKKNKYAYPIKKLYKLESPISLKDLKSNHNFIAPQNFAYIDKYESIRKEVLSNQNLINLF